MIKDILKIETDLGQLLAVSSRRKIFLLVLLVFILVIYAIFFKQQHYVSILVLASLIAYLNLFNGDLDSMGLRWKPKQGWRPWFLTLPILMGLLILGVLAWNVAIHNFPWLKPMDHSQLLQLNWKKIYSTGLYYPIIEELLFRLFITLSLITLIGQKGVILVSGVLFAAMHFLYGNPSIDNASAGFILAWVFLKSESIVVPILFHALANIVILLTMTLIPKLF